MEQVWIQCLDKALTNNVMFATAVMSYGDTYLVKVSTFS